MNVTSVVRRAKGSLPFDGEVEARAAHKRPMRGSSGHRLLAYMALSYRRSLIANDCWTVAGRPLAYQYEIHNTD